jgi:hypothetical protein
MFLVLPKDLLERPHYALEMKSHMRALSMRSLFEQAQTMKPDLLGWAWMDRHVHWTTIFPVILGCTEQ